MIAAWYDHCMTNDELTKLTDDLFTKFIESDDFSYDKFSSHEITLICSRLAMKFAQYASDEIDF